jgi:hypothetical protein
MIKLAARAGINMLGERLDALIAAGKRNSSIAQEKLAAIDCERKKLDTAGKRLRKFGRAYKSDAQGGAAFSAQS